MLDLEALPTDMGQQSVVEIRCCVATGLEDTGWYGLSVVL